MPPDPSILPAGSAPLGRAEDLRRQLFWVTVSWGVFGSIWMWAISGAAMTRFARELGMPDYGFGLLAALPFVGTLVQVPASYFLERYGHRRRFFMITATIHRLLWTVVALIPFFLPGQGLKPFWWPTMIGLLLVSWVLGQASGPAWMNWMSDLIPRRIRGRYFALRNLISQPVGVITTIAIGYALDVVERVEGGASEILIPFTQRPLFSEGVENLMLPVTVAILAIAGLSGTLDVLCFRKVRDDRPPRPKGELRFLTLMGQPLKDRNFRNYLYFNFMFTLALGFIGQYIWLYLLDVVQWSNWKANMLVMAVPLLARMFVYRAWGRVIDRTGKKPVLLITGFMTVFGALGWLFITRDHFWLGYLLVLLTAMAWPGMEIANFNFTLDMAGSRKRGHGKQGEAAGTAYVALNSMAVAIGGVISGFLGASIAYWLEDLHIALGIGGMVLTYHGVLFLLSTGLRAVALIWAAQLNEPRARGTRDAIRFMSDSVWSNVRQAVLMPSRMVGHVTRWSYKIPK